MKSNFFNISFIAIGCNSFKKHKAIQSSNIWQKKMKETPKNGQKTKFQGCLEYQGKIWGEQIHKVYKSIYQL